MKKVLPHFFGKIMILVSLLFAFTQQSKAQITMSTANCTITPTEVQMDIMVTNTGANDLRWNSSVLRMIVPAGMLPATTTYSFNYVGGSDFPLSFPAVFPGPSFGASFAAASRTITWTTGSTSAYNNTTPPCEAPLIVSGVTKKIGRFSFKIATGGPTFIAGQPATFTWSTTSSCNLYKTVPTCAASVTGFNSSSTGEALRTLATPCVQTVPNACAVTGLAVVTNPGCFGGTGSAVVTLSGTGSGAPGFYSLDGGPATNPYSTNPFTVSGLSNGNHSIVATVTPSGCISTPIAANVTEPTQLVASGSAGTIACFGGTTTVVVSASGGTPGYTGTGSFTVSAGPYSFTVTDANGCTSVASGTVADGTALSGTGTATPVSCFGATDGTETITLSSSTSGTYTVDGGVPQNYNSNPFTITGLSGGNHTIVATSAAGCVSNLIGVSVGEPAQLTGSGTTTPTSCGNPNNGTATITLSAFSGAATYTVDGGAPQNYNSNPFTVTGLTSGNHTIVATSAAGCVSSNILVNVGSTGAFTATVAKTNLSACNATNDGTITVTPVGGVGPYSYVWSGGYPGFAPGNVAAVTNLPIGFYNVTVTDLGGCGSATFTNVHVQFAYFVFVTNSGSSSSSCGNTGTVLLYGNAGISPYTYALSAGSSQPTPAPGAFQASNTFTGLAAGNYTGFIKDAGGCVSSKNLTVTAAAAIVVSPFAVGASSCNADGSAQIFRTGGIPPYTYALSPGVAPAGTFQTSNFFGSLASGSYTAYVKDAAGCVGQQTVTVAAGTGITATTSKINSSTCVNDGSIQVNATGGVAPYTYSFNGGAYQGSNAFGGLGAGNYTIQVKDSKGCLSVVLNVTINLNTIVVTATPTAASSCASSNGKIQIFRTGGYGPYTYSLDGNTYQSSNLFINLAPGTYDAYVKDSKTCIGVLNGVVVGPTGCAPTIASNNSKGVKSELKATATSLKVQAYPNPSESEFTVVLEGYDSKVKVSIIVTDLLGRKIYQTEGTGRAQYRFGAGFISGMYNVQVIQGAEKASLKLVKE